LLSGENTSALSDLKQALAEIRHQHDLLMSIRSQVAEQREFNSALADFVQRGLSLVNERKLSDCPLCEQPYQSHIHLAEKIAKNQSLDRALQMLLLQESQAATHLSDLEKSFLEKRLLLEKIYSDKIISLENEIRTLASNQETINKKVADQQNQLRLQSTQQFEIQVEFKGVSIDDHAIILSDRLVSETKKRNELREEHARVQTERDSLQSVVQITRQEISRLAADITTLSRDTSYNSVIRWFELNDLLQPSRDALLKRLDHVTKEISELQAQIETGRKDLGELKIALAPFDKPGLRTQQKEIESRRHEFENAIETFAQFVQRAVEVDSRQVAAQELMKILSAKEIETQTRINSRKKLADELLVLNRYCENIVEFLQSERLKTDLQEKEDEYRFLVSTVRPRIENEIQKTKDFLMSKIKEFFYTDLINDIYKKIDPHPDFREVRFKADFDSENPRLDIFVRNSKNTEALIPNLYFSTAQINILSLSIFLASALNSKEYKCIFVDDPIQSLDSINVLSTIDLIRSIVVNGDRQIILSTHDKNFYDVLQKKIPKGLFKSKFLELESFGKVKAN
jgi:exonuclease SbcC